MLTWNDLDLRAYVILKRQRVIKVKKVKHKWNLHRPELTSRGLRLKKGWRSLWDPSWCTWLRNFKFSPTSTKLEIFRKKLWRISDKSANDYLTSNENDITKSNIYSMYDVKNYVRKRKKLSKSNGRTSTFFILIFPTWIFKTGANGALPNWKLETAQVKNWKWTTTSQKVYYLH